MKKKGIESAQSVGTALPGSETILTFRLGKQLYGMPIMVVTQIIEIVAITHLPQLPRGIQGAINVHGQIVPVVDLRVRFGLECAPYHLRTPMILAEAHGRTLALVVDAVDDVVTVTPVDAPIPTDIKVPTTYLREVVQVGQAVVPVLEVQHVLSQEERTQLARLLPSANRPQRNAQNARQWTLTSGAIS